MTEVEQHIMGRIEAVALLASALAAQTSPVIASVVLERCKALRLRDASGSPLTPFERGFASIESTIMQSLTTVDAAQQLREVDKSKPQ